MTKVKDILELFGGDMMTIIGEDGVMIDSGECEELLKEEGIYLNRTVKNMEAVCFTTDYDVSLIIEIGEEE